MRRRGRIGKRRNSAKRKITFLLFSFIVLWLAYQLSTSPFFSPERSQAKTTVEQFYQLEQRGDFGSAWELFHSEMKQKFSKDAYIQRRAHVFMQELGAQTFDYTVGSPVSLSTWQMSSDTPLLQNVYKIPVTEAYNSNFGRFVIYQDVYVAYENKQWRILWSY